LQTTKKRFHWRNRFFYAIEVISKVIQNKGKEQNHSPVKGSLRQLPVAVTAGNAPFAGRRLCLGRLLMSFEITSIQKVQIFSCS